MIPDFNADDLREAVNIVSAELLQMHRDLTRLKGRDNREVQQRLIRRKEQLLEFVNWNMKEMGI